jgi:hypothetical protein
LAADDTLYDSEALMNASNALNHNCSGIVTSRVMKCDSMLTPISIFNNRFQKHLPQMTSGECFKELCVHNDIIAVGVFFSKSFFENYGYFDERYKLLEDWPKWLSVTRQGCQIGYANFTGTKYRSNVGCATSVNDIYLQDKRQTFRNEIYPYRSELGSLLILKAKIVLLVRNSVFVRKVYALFFRK